MLLSIGNDAKTVKGEKLNYMTGILYLYPSESPDICPAHTSECISNCLVGSGHGRFENVQSARIKKTRLFKDDYNKFIDQLYEDIDKLIIRANKKGMVPCVRLNGTSDINWMSIKKSPIKYFKDVQFYDYTKVPGYLKIFKKYDNYDLTFSYNGLNWDFCEKVLKDGVNVSKIFFQKLPSDFKSFSVINGDENDLRFLDPKGSIVGLKHKKTKKENVIMIKSDYIN